MNAHTSSADRDPVERLAEDYLDRRRRGEQPSVSEYAHRFPQLAERINVMFPALALMEQLKPDSDDQTASAANQDQRATHMPDQLGEYRIIREIGHGGMGVVYEAIQESLGRHVALKILPWHGRIDPVQIERFQVEARSAARLHHTHIVPVYGVGEHQGVQYYAMQYIQGHGLDAILEDLRRLRGGATPSATGEPHKADTGSVAVARSLLTGRFASSRADRKCDTPSPTNSDGQDRAPDSSAGAQASASGGSNSVLSHPTESGYHRAVARLAIQVAGALAHAHQQGVLHRDIKPSNLLLDVDGHVWVTDFGLAKVEGADGPTQTGDIVGTLRYMAPERFDGWSDRRSDIYGLGTTLYELVTLRPAFAAATKVKLIEQVIHDPPVAPRKVDSRIPRDLETIVLKAIAKEPGERYATVEALAADLTNYLTDRPIVARRSSPVERAWRWCRRNPATAALLAVSAVTLLTLVGLGVALGYQSRLQAAYAEKDAALARELTFLYQNRVLVAQRKLEDDEVEQAEELLDECPADHRAWEWHYLKRQCHTELLTLSGHTGIVYAVASSRDGRWIASGGDDKIIRIWEAATGKMKQSLHGHGESIQFLAFSSDGTRLASLGGALTHPDRLLVHEVKSWTQIVNKGLDTGEMCGLAYSPDGRSLAIASGERKEAGWVRIVDADTGGEQRTFDIPERWAFRISFSPDGKRLLTVIGLARYGDPDLNRNQLVVWDIASGQVCQRLPAPGDVFALYSPDGRRIATSGLNTTVTICDAATGKQLGTCIGHRHGVNCLAFSPDSRQLASGSDDSTAKIWDVETRAELLHLRGHHKAVYGVAFSADGRQLVTASQDRNLKVFDARSSREAITLGVHQGEGTWITFSRDGQRLLSCGKDHSMRLWEVGSGRSLETWADDHSEPVLGAAFSPDGLRVASAAGDWTRDDKLGEVFVRDAFTGHVKYRWKVHRGAAWSVAFSHDGRLLASGGGDYRTPDHDLILWDVATGTKKREFKDLPGGIRNIAFTLDDQRVVAAVGRSIQSWEIETGRLAGSFTADESYVNSCALSPDGRWIVSFGFNDMNLKVWDTSSGYMVRKLSEGLNSETVPVFSPDGQRIAGAGSQDNIRIWDFASGQNLVTLRVKSPARGVAFSPDGSFIASIHKNGEIKLWDGSPVEEGAR